MTMPPAEVSHLRVYLTDFSLVTADGADADNLPDWEGADGTVTITPQLAANSVVITSGGRGFIPMEKSFALTAGNFEAWVLNPSDPDLNPSGWTYKVTVTVTTPSRAVITGTLAPQAGDTDINLLPLLPLSSSTGGLVTVPPSGLTESQLLALDADENSAIREQQDARHMSTYEAKRGADDNYMTSAQLAALHSHANKTALDQVSGTNTGDQDLSGYVPTSRTVAGKALSANITLTAADLTDHTEATQDVVGAMVTAAGGTYDDAAGSITLPSGGGIAPLPAPPVGRWITPTRTIRNSSGGLTGEIGTEYAMLVQLPSITIDAIGSRIWAGQVSLVGRIGIYADAGGIPSTTVLHDLGTVNLTTNGARTTVLGTPVSITAGWYWVSIVQQVGTTPGTWLICGEPLHTVMDIESSLDGSALLAYTRTGVTGGLSVANGTQWSGKLRGLVAANVSGEGKLPLVALRRSA